MLDFRLGASSPSLRPLVLLLLFTACGGGGGASSSGTGSSGNGALPDRDWGAPPPAERGPGVEAPVDFQARILIANSGAARTETVRASVPFPWGRVQDLASSTIQGAETAWLVLQRWPDQSVRIAQAQWQASLQGGETRAFVVEQGTALTQAFAQHPAIAERPIEFGAEVRDTFGVPYRAVWQEGEAVQETSLCRVRKARLYHRATAGAGIGRDYLTSTFYVTEFRNEPFVVVDWLLGNDYLGKDAPGGSSDPNLYPLGGIDVRSAAFLHKGADHTRAYQAEWDAIEPGVVLQDGFTSQRVLADTFLGDGQMRRYRFVLYREDASLTPVEQTAQRATADAIADAPLRPLADLATWRASNALSLLGGPCNPPQDAAFRIGVDMHEWSIVPHFGSFGSRGDPKTTGETGTPRNHPLSPELAHAAQSEDPRPLLVLEQKAWVQAMRPYHLHGLRVANSDRILLWDGVPIYPGSRDLSPESLGRRRLRDADPYGAYRTMVGFGEDRAHGFQHFDQEHWTSALVFDHYTVTGDAWAKDEMRQLGESLRGLMRPQGFFTSAMQSPRSEGWVMQGLVQAYVATGDLRYRSFAIDRVRDVVERDRIKNHPSGALFFEGSDGRTPFPTPHRYMMPWQHGAVLYGYLAAWKFFGDPLFLSTCERVSACVDYAWARDFQDSVLGSVPNALRYYCPVEYQGSPVLPNAFDASIGVIYGDGPLSGANSIPMGGLLLLSQVTQNESVRQMAEQYGVLLARLPLRDDFRWNKWYSILPPPFGQ